MADYDYSKAYKINGTVIKPPTQGTFTEKRYNLTKAERIANGDMTLDFIAKKRTWQMKWDAMDSEEFMNIMALIDTEEMFFEFTFPGIGGNPETYTCYAGAISRTRDRGMTGNNGIEYYKDVQFQIIMK